MSNDSISGRELIDPDAVCTLLARTVLDTRHKTIYGNVTKIVGTLLKTDLRNVEMGEQCELLQPDGVTRFVAEVVALEKDGAVLSPLCILAGLSPRTRVIGTGRPFSIKVGPWLLGSVLDGLGNVVTLGGPINPAETQNFSVNNEPPDPMSRSIIDEPMSTGVRAIDSMITCGRGQRLGIFGMAGCGKSSLMAMITKGAAADVFVFGMIGERGREIREFIEHNLGPDGMRRSVMVVATSDRPAAERLKAACIATAIAEYFRDLGLNVVLFIDSVTRYARALREIGLAAGEPAARRGFPPSVFAELPRLVERAGPAAKGTITAFYTVLAEGDFSSDPVAEEVKSLLDGHILLSPKLANAGHYPAIDVLGSKSRVVDAITVKQHRMNASRIRMLLAKYDEVELLLQVGEFRQGADAMADEAVAKIEDIRDFLQQSGDDLTPYFDTLQRLERLAD